MPTSDAVRPPTPINARGIRPAAIALGLALSLALGACSSSDDDALVKAKQGTGRVSASDTLPADSTVAPGFRRPTTRRLGAASITLRETLVSERTTSATASATTGNNSASLRRFGRTTT